MIEETILQIEKNLQQQVSQLIEKAKEENHTYGEALNYLTKQQREAKSVFVNIVVASSYFISLLNLYLIHSNPQFNRS